MFTDSKTCFPVSIESNYSIFALRKEVKKILPTHQSNQHTLDTRVNIEQLNLKKILMRVLSILKYS